MKNKPIYEDSVEENKHDINIDSLLKANTKLVDENKYLKDDKIFYKSRIDKVLKAIDIELQYTPVNVSPFLKGIKKVLQGERSSTIEELMRTYFYSSEDEYEDEEDIWKQEI